MRTYRVSENKWEHADGSVKVCGTEAPCATQGSGWAPPEGERIGRTGRPRKKASGSFEEAVLAAGGKSVRLAPCDGKGRFWKRKVGWVRAWAVGEAVPDAGYVQVDKVRRSAVAAALLALLAALFAAYCAVQQVAPADAPALLAGQAGIANPNKDAKATVEYATYESTPDQKWKAGTRKQEITLRLPATVSGGGGDQDGRENPVVAAPSLWVDLDGDGEYASDECVFNPPTYNDDGTVKDPGKCLEPGKQVDSVELTRTIPKGEYKARTRWTPVTAEGGANANPMTFNWNLEVS